MKRFRVSIAGLLGLVCYAAVAFAALKDPSILWASVLFTAVVALLLTVTLAVFFSRRPWLRGFMVFGWGYLVLSFATNPLPTPITNLVVQDAFYDVYGITRVPGTKYPIAPREGFFWFRGGIGLTTKDTLTYNQISHSILCPLFGFVGATMARVMASRSAKGTA